MIRTVPTNKKGARQRAIRILSVRRAHCKALPALKLVTHRPIKSLAGQVGEFRLTDERSGLCVSSSSYNVDRLDAIQQLARIILKRGKANVRGVFAWGLQASRKPGIPAATSLPLRWRNRS